MARTIFKDDERYKDLYWSQQQDGNWRYLAGDSAKVDEDGFYYIVDRKKSIIGRGGENIAAMDVEEHIHHHGDVIEACAFPVPDDRLGEEVGAIVQRKPGTDPSVEELQAHVRNHLASFKPDSH